MAGLSGLALGGPRLPWNREKTWSGLAAFVLFGTAASAWIIRWVQQGATGSLSFLVIGCLVATTAAALAESLDTDVDDNILVPLVGGAVLWAATLVDPGLLVAAGAATSATSGAGGALTAPDALTGTIGVTDEGLKTRRAR